MVQKFGGHQLRLVVYPTMVVQDFFHQQSKQIKSLVSEFHQDKLPPFVHRCMEHEISLNLFWCQKKTGSWEKENNRLRKALTCIQNILLTWKHNRPNRAQSELGISSDLSPASVGAEQKNILQTRAIYSTAIWLCIDMSCPFNSIHKLSLDNEKQTFLRFWFRPSLASHRLEDIRRHVVNMVQQLPQDPTNRSEKPSSSNHPFFRCYATFRYKMTINHMDSLWTLTKEVRVLSKSIEQKKTFEMRKRGAIGQKKKLLYQLNIHSQPRNHSQLFPAR